MASLFNKLEIENFGPIKKAKIEVKDMMVFIGPQASGKSTLAKLITILDDINFKQNTKTSLKEELEKYNIATFLKANTIIEYNTPSFSFELRDKKEYKFDINTTIERLKNIHKEKKSLEDFSEVLNVTSQMLGIMLSGIILDEKSDILIRELQKHEDYGLNSHLEDVLLSDKKSPSTLSKNLLKSYNKNIEDIDEFIALIDLVKQVFSIIHPLDSLYIPAERTLLPLLAPNIAGLINNDILIPKNLLFAVQQFEKALQQVNDVDLNIIGNFRFKHIEGRSYIYHNKNQKVLLKDSASGIQSFLPILLLIENSLKSENYINLNYVVEEPELNLYPEAQYNLVKYLVKNCLETTREIQTKNLIITTHSPYILSSINNLLLAYNKGKINKDITKSIVNEKSWIAPEHFNAYEVRKGYVKKIFSKKIGLINDNMIDDVSDIILQDFKSLALIR